MSFKTRLERLEKLELENGPPRVVVIDNSTNETEEEAYRRLFPGERYNPDTVLFIFLNDKSIVI